MHEDVLNLISNPTHMQLKLKARLALSGIAVIAIMAGTYAFKGRSSDAICVRTAGTTLCTLRLIAYTTINHGTPFITVTYATTICGPCFERRSIYVGL